MTAREKIRALVDGGLEASHVDAFWALVDMGEIHESEILEEWAEKLDGDRFSRAEV